MSSSEEAWFRWLCVLAGLLQAVFVAVRVLISYRALELDCGAATIGVLTAAYSLVPLVIALRLGRLVDGRHLSATLRVGVLLSVLSVCVIAMAFDFWVLLGGSILLGVGNLLTMVAAQSYVPRRSPPGDFDRRFGAFSLWVSIGQAVGLPVAGAVASTAAGTVGALFAMAGIAVVAAGVSWARSLSATTCRPSGEDGPPRSARSMIADPGMRAAIFSSLMVLTAIDLVAAYLPLLGAERGWTVAAVTAILTCRAVASMVSRACLTPLLRWVPRRALLIAGTAATVIPVAALPVFTDAWAAAALMVVAGFFWGIAQPLSMTWVAQLVPPGHRGSALSLRMTGNRLGQVVIPAAAGGLAAVSGVGVVFAATATMLSAAAALTWHNTRS